MKELITTQLIEEYQKELEIKEKNLRHWKFSYPLETTKTTRLEMKVNMYRKFITSLQSKQSEERQNIVDAVDNAIKTTLNSNTNIVLTGEDYFNQTFKQEQK